MPNAGELARIGNLPIAHGVTVVVESNAAVGALQVSNNAEVWVRNLASLNVIGDVLVTGDSSRLRIFTTSPLGFTAGSLTIEDQAFFSIDNGSEIHIQDSLVIGSSSRFAGRGVISLSQNAGVALRNDGTIDTYNGLGGLVINQDGNGLLDLDGLSGNGTIIVDEGNGFHGQDRLTVNGTELNDPFSGVIQMATASILTMNLSEGWTADAGSVISIRNRSVNGDGVATIEGGHLTLAGQLNVFNGVFHNGELGRPVDLNAEVTVLPTASVSLEQGNDLRFNEATRIEGGTFETHSLLSDEGAVRFNADTTYDGNVTVNGIALQNGDATVSNFTTIDAGVFDMDGGGGTEWNINSLLTINAASIDTVPENIFAGTANVAGNFLGRLTINLADPNDQWRMDGTLNLHNDLPFGAERLAGSHVVIGHELNVDGTGIRVDADTTFATTSDTTFVTDDSSLIMQRVTRVEAGTTFVGDGLLANHAAGHMTLYDGVGTDDVGLRNGGLLDIDDAAGIVTVDRFENTADGTLAIDIGGHLLGDEFDHLHVAGETILDGVLAVDLLLDEFAFLPEIGDEFMILTSLGGVSGEFAGVLPTFAGDQVFGWEVLYHPHDVTIRLADIGTAVPEPTTISLLALAVIGGAARRR